MIRKAQPQGAPSLYIKILMNLVLHGSNQDSDELNGDIVAQTAIMGSLVRWELRGNLELDIRWC